MIEIIDMLPKPEIEQKASELLSKLDLVGEIPVPAEKIAEYLGFECYLFDPNPETADIAGAVNHRNKKIFINKTDSPKKQLFTVAHEIGHIILHGDKNDYLDYRRSNSSDIKEKESDYFAACLLMPHDIFNYQWKSLNGDITKLSEIFGVNSSAIAARANLLGLSY